MTPEPAIVTDVFDFLMGDGFVMVGGLAGNGSRKAREPEIRSALTPAGNRPSGSPTREVWIGIEEDVERLERLLRTP